MSVTALDEVRLRARVMAIAGAVVDPEIPVLTIGDLGVLRDARVDAAGGVEVDITPTYSGCPAMNVVATEVAAALHAAGIADVRVRLVLSPAWTTDWLTPAGRAALLAYGIAPPAALAQARGLFGAEEDVQCPRCRSTATEKLSAFGSTACKALWRCTACREPFDHFKCL